MTRVHLEKLEVHHLYGRRFEGLKLDSLSPGLTVVYGPNAAGKTVLASGASRLFSAADTGDRFDQIAAAIRIGGTSQLVEVRERGQPPSWPQSVRTDLYLLSIPDLIKGVADEDHTRIKQALAGGLDLKRLSPQSPGRVPRRDLTATLDVLRQKRGTAEQLRQQEAELPHLREELGRARRAKEDLDLIQRWLEAAGHDGEATRLAEQIDRLRADHPGIEAQTEQAAEDVRQDRAAHRDALHRVAETRRVLARYAGRRAAAPLQVVDDKHLHSLEQDFRERTGRIGQAEAQLEERMSEARAAQRELDLHAPGLGRSPAPLSPVDRQQLVSLVTGFVDSTRRAVEATARRDESRRALDHASAGFRNAGGDLAHIPGAAPDVDQVQHCVRLDSAIEAAERAVTHARATHQEAQRKHQEVCEGANVRLPPREILRQLQQPPGIASLMDAKREIEERRRALLRVAEAFEQEAGREREIGKAAENAAAALRDWLRAIPSSSNGTRPTALVVAALTLAAVTVVIGFTIGPWAGATVGTASLAGVAAALLIRRPAMAGDRRPEIQARVPADWRPETWSIDSVSSTYARAVDVASGAAAMQRAAHDSAQRARDADPQDVAAKLEHRREIFCQTTGMEAPDGYELAALVTRLDRLADAKEACDSSRRSQRDAEQQLDQLRRQLSTALAAMAAPSQTGLAAKEWADALRHLLSAQAADLVNAAAASDAQAGRDQASRSLVQFFARFGWPCDGDPLAAKEGMDRWFELTSRLASAEEAAAGARTECERLSDELRMIRQGLATLFGKYGFSVSGDPAISVAAFRDWFLATEAVSKARRVAHETRQRLLRRLKENGITASGRLTVRIDLLRDRHPVAAQWRSLTHQRGQLRAQAAAVRNTPGWELVFRRLGLRADPSLEQLLETRQTLAATAASADQIQKTLAETEARLDEATRANDLAAAQAGLDRSVAQVDAWLHRTLIKRAADSVIDAITQAHRREARPRLTDRANAWLRRFTNERYDGITANGEVHVVDRREGINKTLNQLSTGTKAHVALAVRLAVIEQSETDVRFPLFLDEVLATSDPEASAAIAAALAEVATDRQVVMFTNQPDDLNVLRAAVGDALAEISLPAAQPPLVAPPISPPAAPIPATSGDPKPLPLASSILQWRPDILADLLPELDLAAPTVHDALGELVGERQASVKAILDAIDSIRQRVAAAHHPLRWADIQAQSWAGGDMSDRVHQALEDSRGRAREFLAAFNRIPRMRQDKKDACEQWLEENGYLTEPPSIGVLTDAAFSDLPEAVPHRRLIAQGLAAMFAPYTSP